MGLELQAGSYELRAASCELGGRWFGWYPDAMSGASLFALRMAMVTGAVVGLSGCHSHYVEATVRNASGATISPFEVDYPSASFGRPALANGAEYHYRFKVLGDGTTKVLWTDTRHSEHSVLGPALNEGDEGRLTVTIGVDGAELKFVPSVLAQK